MAAVQIDPVAWLAVLATGGLYAVGVRRMAARRTPWSQARAASMVAALLVVLVATTSPLGAGTPLRQAVSQALLVYVAPLLVVLAAPATLAVEAADRVVARRVRRVVGSRALRLLAAPPASIGLVLGLQALCWLTGLHREAAVHAWVAVPLQLAFVVAGWLYFTPLWGTDPVPRRLGQVQALAHVLVLLPLTTLMGECIEAFATGAGPSGAGVTLAGGVLWTVGSLASIPLAVAVLVRWLRTEERAAPGRRAGLDEGAHAQLVAWRAAREAAAAEEAERWAAVAARRR